MEWRQQSTISCADAFNEAQRWMEEVTGKSFGSKDFRAALENGVLLCDLINQLKPGIIKRLNRLSTPIAGLDNVNVFLKACGKLGLNESQLFHPGDLQDLSTRVTLRREESSRRLKNVLITIYWLGRKAQLDPFYSGPQLNFKAFEGLLGLALSKALDDGSSVSVKDSRYREYCYPEREELRRMRPGYRRENSADSIESLDWRARRTGSECCGSDAEAEQGFRMEATQPAAQQNKAHVPPPLLRRRQGWEKNGRDCPSSLTRSKSMSDIPMVYPVHKVPDGNMFDAGQHIDEAREWKQEHLQRSTTGVKEGEAKWQDDLTKWKMRRKSTNSDLLRKLQEREHAVKQITNGAVTGLKENGTHGGLPQRDPQSLSSRNPAPTSSSTCPASKSSCSDLQPRTRALLARSYTSDGLFSPTAPYNTHNPAHAQEHPIATMPGSDVTVLAEEAWSGSLAPDEVTTPSLGYPFSSQTQAKVQGSTTSLQPTSELARPGNILKDQITSGVTTELPNDTITATCANDSRAAVTNGPISAMDTGFCHMEVSPMDPKVPIFHQTTADAQRSQAEAQQMSVEASDQQAPGLYRYISRTGSWSGSASLPRGYRRSEGSSRLSAVVTARPYGTKPSRVSSLPRLCNEDNNASSLLNSEQDGSLQLIRPTLTRQAATSQIMGQGQASVTQNSGNQEAKQNGEERRDEGKHASSFSRFSCQTSSYRYQPYAQTQPVALLTKGQSHHSKTPTLSSNLAIAPPEVHHSDMRVSLSLKPNSRPDFGFETHWDSTGARVKFVEIGSPAELCQLCVGDEIVAVDGIAVAHMKYDQWRNTMTSALQNGNLNMDIRRYGNKDWSTSGGSHHNQPCQSRKTLNLTATAPILIGHPGNAASAETTVVESSKINGQPVNGIDCRGMAGEFSDNSRSKGGSESAISDLQVPSLNASSSGWSWDHEEERRRQEKWQEEQERLLQEQYQRDQERLEAEWRKAQQDATGEYRKPELNACEITKGLESSVRTNLPVNGIGKKDDGWSPEREDVKRTGSKPQRNGQAVQNDTITEQDWAAGSCGFAQLSPAHRAKSKSTPALASLHKQTRGDQKKKGQCISKAEQERQQILEEMKKRTQLLTDNSWIRQRSSSIHKEPVYTGVPLKRYESLDNLHTSAVSSTMASPHYSRPHSAAGFSLPSRTCSPRYSVGPGLSQRQQPWSIDSSSGFIPGDEPANQSLPGSQQYGRFVSGKKTCCVCEHVLGRGAAMVIEALGLCCHLACFQCVECCRPLGGTETGVQVRIRNKKPYCEPCYFHFKYMSAPSM
ncbi:LIM domain only protein 7b isoform X2 [Myripristis murdjan]|uniref:LIM domain only protein 7b isoform X2 n=1 Tax=Myripristis murdjan TaxID=586833 RepID=UPI001175CF80|nr:LIM domain only protein 7-like isoform X2 [Myripristis murdjan]